MTRHERNVRRDIEAGYVAGVNKDYFTHEDGHWSDLVWLSLAVFVVFFSVGMGVFW